MKKERTAAVGRWLAIAWAMLVFTQQLEPLV